MAHPSVTLALLLISVNLCMSQNSSQHMSLHRLSNCEEQSIFRNLNKEPDLTSVELNGQVHSVSAKGIWLFYENPNYEGSSEFTFAPNAVCFILKLLAGIVTQMPSSVRFAGRIEDYKADSLTLYTGVRFQGQEEYTQEKRLATLKLDKVSSLIITGATPWTLYALPNYQGKALCVYPPASRNLSPGYIQNTSSSVITISISTIRSIRRGCFSNNKVTAQSIPVTEPAG